MGIAGGRTLPQCALLGPFQASASIGAASSYLIVVQHKIGDGVKFYYEDRPPSSLNYLQPKTFNDKWNELILDSAETVI